MRPTEQYKGYKSYEHNKQFKRDSARVAFWVCGGFCVEVPCSGLVMACFTP
ncbi:DUF3265 domain-containing protein [Vibrio parahaemolyticus]|nr:DUF3265 domain-containing protein [Vibrio parahaemolyticus]MBE3862463.1 DUF3265 domain-containing protein [Vibrio parahaemolyticus]TNZ82929.1 DUF3265 domain-containing protein [Vibrio parahaemolyticus]TOB16353.1 DUF3265 domain-containing protein [Vibrio parahaemolyticus]HCM0830677.1 DUF3265 domain-containing protein [Vibrio parahaemolyticus]